MIACSRCGAETPSNFSYCQVCGIRLEVTRAAPAETPRRFGRYLLLEQLTRDPVVEAFLAVPTDDLDRMHVLLRVHDETLRAPDLNNAFAYEMGVLSCLEHPAICRVLHVGREASAYAATEHVAGPSLAAVIARLRKLGTPMSIAMARYIARELLAALDYAHNKMSWSGSPLGLVHGGCSPRTVRVSYNGQVKLAGFGLSGLLMHARKRASTADLSYVPPERSQDQRDRRSDLFAVASVLYECLTGRALFPAAADAGTRAWLLSSIPSVRHLNPMVPREMDRVIHKALSPDPETRYTSADDMARALARGGDETRDRIETEVWLSEHFAREAENDARAAERRGPALDAFRRSLERDAELLYYDRDPAMGVGSAPSPFTASPHRPMGGPTGVPKSSWSQASPPPAKPAGWSPHVPNARPPWSDRPAPAAAARSIDAPFNFKTMFGRAPTADLVVVDPGDPLDGRESSVTEVLVDDADDRPIAVGTQPALSDGPEPFDDSDFILTELLLGDAADPPAGGAFATGTPTMPVPRDLEWRDVTVQADELHLRVELPELRKARSATMRVGRTYELVVDLGSKIRTERGATSSALTAKALETAASVDVLDVIVICPGANIWPLRGHLAMPPRPDQRCIFEVTPMRAGVIALEVFLMVANQAIHNVELCLETDGDDATKPHVEAR